MLSGQQPRAACLLKPQESAGREAPLPKQYFHTGRNWQPEVRGQAHLFYYSHLSQPLPVKMVTPIPSEPISMPPTGHFVGTQNTAAMTARDIPTYFRIRKDRCSTHTSMNWP